MAPLDVSMHDYTYHITLDPEVPPLVHAPRRETIQLKYKLQAELREMKSQGIIARVTRPTDRVNSLVIREMSGTARIHLITLMIDDNLTPTKNCVMV